MKASKYNVIVEDPATGGVLLYNSLYGSLTAWSKDEVAIVNRLLAFPDAANGNGDIQQVLREQKHLIEDAVDEMAIIENRKRSGVADSNRLDVIIMPTLDCNFACAYCYETHQASSMSDDTERAIKLWLSHEMPKHTVVLLHWFGGEPLLGFQRVVSITEHATAVALRSGTCCVPHMTTNGFLLDQRRATALTQAGVHNFQITLDGPPDTHDRLRVLKNGRGTFRQVFENVVGLMHVDDRVRVSLRVNFNQGNLHSIPTLLEMFPGDIRSRLRVVYEPIFGRCALSASDNLPSEEISQAMAQYYTIAEQLGYDVVLGLSNLSAGKLVYCYAERDNQVIINYNGDLHKCSVSEFRTEDRVGFIRTDGSLVRDEQKWSLWTDGELFSGACRSCSYLPLCMGGCRKTRLEQRGPGNCCALTPTNASYLLKQIAYGRFPNLVRQCDQPTAANHDKS
jgi:uncharacterized protein